jgi:hypothetical protein
MRPARTAVRRDTLPSSLAGRWREHPRAGTPERRAGPKRPKPPWLACRILPRDRDRSQRRPGCDLLPPPSWPDGLLAAPAERRPGARPRGPAGPGAGRGQARGCRPARRAADHLAEAGANYSTPQRTCVLMKKASQRVRQYVLINSMSQASLSARSRSYDAFADARRALGTVPGRSARPPADLFTASELPIGGVCATRTGRRWPPAPRRSWPAGERRAAARSSALTGPPRSPGAVPGHGQRLAAGRAPGPNVPARAP